MPALFFGLVITGLCFYIPALNSAFILDDYPNFDALSRVHDFADALNYAINGESGTRYLSYLSFTLHSQSWLLKEAFAFKATNLLIHCLNGLLVYFVTFRILHYQKIDSPVLPSLTITAIWLLHPIHTGTVLYSVQRMSLLSASFVLCGILFHFWFLQKQQHLAKSHFYRWTLYTGSLWLITFLGIICKETAILLLALIALLNSHLKNAPLQAWQRHITLLLPLLALLVFLLATHRLNFNGRDFTLFQRLLSEYLILQEYLLKIALPRENSFSLFYDDFKTVQTFNDLRLLSTTLFWLSLITLTVFINRYAKGFAFGIGWFFISHLLESTIIPLELYFDHRNYLPSYGLLFSLVILCNALWQKRQNHYERTLLMTLATAWLFNSMHLLKSECYFWRDEQKLATSLIIKHPDSLRAHQYLAEAQFNSGHLLKSINTTETIHKKFGIKPSTVVHQITTSCLINPDVQINFAQLIQDLPLMPYDTNSTSAMEKLFSFTRDNLCHSLTWDIYRSILSAFLSAPKNSKEIYNLTYLMVLSHIEEDNRDDALAASLLLPKPLRQMPYLLLQLDLAIRTNNKPMAKALYNDLAEFDYFEKLLYKEELEKIDLFMRQYLSET